MLSIFGCNVDLQHTTKSRRPFQFKNTIGGGRAHPSGYAPELNWNFVCIFSETGQTLVKIFTTVFSRGQDIGWSVNYNIVIWPAS